MAKIDVISLYRELKQGRLRSLYVIVGEEEYLAKSALSNIEAALLGTKSQEKSETIIEGKELTLPKFYDAIRSIPLFGGNPVVVVRDADDVSKDVLDSLVTHLNEIPEHSTAVFVAKKIDGRGRFMQAASKMEKAAVIECKTLYANQLPSWINMEMKRQKKQISHEAAVYLADLVGNDLGQLSQSIEHVSLFVGARTAVELSDVEEAIAETTQRSVFELTDAIGLRDKKRAISVLKNLLDHGTQPVLILNMIARHFRILTRAKEVEGRGTGSDIAGYLGVKPFFVKNYMEQSRKFCPSELRKKFGLLSRCDRELKSSRIPKERILERLVLGL